MSYWRTLLSVVFNKMWINFIPLLCGFYFGKTGNMIFLIVGLLPTFIILDAETERLSRKVKIERFQVKENGKGKK